MTSVEKLHNADIIPFTSLNTQKQAKTVKLEQEPDSFEKTSDKKAKEDKSTNGKFDISECAKNFVQGVFSPLTAVIKHPVITLGVVGATALACTLVPVLGPVMGIGFGALSAFQLGKGIYNVVKNYKNADYDKAEKSFNEVGQGTSGVVMSVFGLKQNAKVAKEAKLMNKLGVNSLNAEQKAQIAAEVKAGTKLDAIKEIGSLFTTKDGLKALGSQFKPSNIIQRGKDAFNFLFKKEDVTKIKKEKMKFVDTAEGKRRAAMSSEEIKTQAEALYKEAFDEYGIPNELRPKIEVRADKTAQIGGQYLPNEHKIVINETAYREGYFDLPDVIKHESTHAKEAILRQRLSADEKEKIIVEYLLDKIQNGDKDNILTGKGTLVSGAEKVKPPKMNAKMKTDFAKLAQEKLYQMTDYSDSDFTSMVKPLVESNPDYIKGYDSVDDAIAAMKNYAQNHNFRYKMAANHASGFNTSGIDTSLLKELSDEERVLAIQSFKDGIDCLESNAAGQGGLLGLGSDFNQYQFTPEEVLAQQKGNNFEITKLQEQLDNLRANENYDIAQEARLLDQIKRCELTIEYKTKGQTMYKLKTEAFNHPENTDLAAKVEAMEKELALLEAQIKEIQGGLSFDEIQHLCRKGKDASEVLELGKNNPINEYTTYIAHQRIPMGASVEIPASTLAAADIISQNMETEDE